ncbi:hypothetical protein A5320_13850 [Rheinheimera sp. SA_1]|jgi:hypothetical protein|uniref:hypothetical protein n=1 Tax=Rheinheimera sp. SA_1 TaxID=1827365 RepID=UPI0008013B1F|nr:hypothetical protein [Rheinheimera sp. SA_1]OBP14798.1 hypothetical protein A5320_13850 [Rheinheimera sp. SA_1]
MSLIQVIEQLGANSALQQLTPAELKSLFTNDEIDNIQLEAVVSGDIENLNALLNTIVYQCVVQVPAEQEDEPVEEDEQESSKQSIHLQ